MVYSVQVIDHAREVVKAHEALGALLQKKEKDTVELIDGIMKVDAAITRLREVVED